jgi:hypothetical protein
MRLSVNKEKLVIRRGIFVSLVFVLLPLLVLGDFAYAQRVKDRKDAFIYKPIRRDFWLRIDKLIKDGKTLEVFKQRLPDDVQSIQDEWKLGMARALIAAGAPIHAQYLLTTVATKSIGTGQGFEALHMIHEIAKAGIADETSLEEVAFELDTKVDEPDTRSMVAYFRARALLRKGYPNWSEQALHDVAPGTTWSDELNYDRTMQTLNAGDSVAAYTRFESLAKSSVARATTSRLSRLALARLVFERKDYRAAISTYASIDLPTRERVRSLNELAWGYYYDRAYGKALGAIQAMKSPFYRTLLSPETLLLEMLIYRELCHYQKVKDIADDFQETFKPVFSQVESRLPLDTVPQFVQMALQEGIMQKRADAIREIRIERRQISKQAWAADDVRESLVKLGEKRERITDAEISRLLKVKSDTLANWFLDLREQVWFLEYEASMRMIQQNDEANEQYEPPKPNKSRPDVMFWPVTNEAWLDELLDYEVLVRDVCHSKFDRGGF